LYKIFIENVGYLFDNSPLEFKIERVVEVEWLG